MEITVLFTNTKCTLGRKLIVGKRINTHKRILS